MKDNAQNQDPAARIRRQYSAEEKVRLLRLHLVEGQPISTIWDKHQIHSTLFYQWQKTFFVNGAAAFERSPRLRRMDLGNAKVEQLEARLRKKDEVIAAVTDAETMVQKAR